MFRRYLRNGIFGQLAARMELHKAPDGKLSFQGRQGDPERLNSVLVISNPKSGTYFTGAILNRLGLVDTRIHFLRSLCILDDYRQIDAAANAGVENPAARAHCCFYHVSQLVNLIRPGQFAVSHLLPNKRDIRALANTKKLLVFRELRSAIVSYIRYNIKSGFAHRDKRSWADMPQSADRTVAAWDTVNEIIIKEARQRQKFALTANTLPVSYEELVGDFGPETQLACYQNIVRLACRTEPEGFDYEDLISQTLNKNTFTFSGKRSDCGVAWDQRCERLFLDSGGEEVNKDMFAYLPESTVSDVLEHP